jgi:hypothetical protein
MYLELFVVFATPYPASLKNDFSLPQDLKLRQPLLICVI